MIKEFLTKKVDKIREARTADADIIFEVNKTKYAIEIETGKVLKTNKKQLLQKIKLLNEKYGKNCKNC